MPPDVTSNREGTPPPHSHTLDASDVSMLPPTFNSSLQYLGMYKHPARHCDLAVQNDTATQFPFIGHMTQMWPAIEEEFSVTNVQNIVAIHRKCQL